MKDKEANWHREKANNLRRTLVFKNGLMPMGLLEFCLDYARRTTSPPGGIFNSVRSRFAKFKETQLCSTVNEIYTFRNTYVAHQNQELTDVAVSKKALRAWITGLQAIYRAHHLQRLVDRSIEEHRQTLKGLAR